VKCGRIRLAVSCSPQPQPHFIRGPSGRPRLTLGLLRRWWEWLEPGLEQPGGRFGHMVKCARIWRPVSSAPRAPAASHPRSTGAPDEIECRVLLKLPHTNLTPALATSLRHTKTAERQNRVVALRKGNILAAAQTDRHVGDTSRTVDVIEQPVFGRGFLQLFHLTARLERKPAFPSRWRAPGSIGGGLRGVWVRAIWGARPCARPEWESAL
jgi:hypothetical protein